MGYVRLPAYTDTWIRWGHSRWDRWGVPAAGTGEFYQNDPDRYPKGTRRHAETYYRRWRRYSRNQVPEVRRHLESGEQEEIRIRGNTRTIGAGMRCPVEGVSAVLGLEAPREHGGDEGVLACILMQCLMLPVTGIFALDDTKVAYV